MELNRGLLAGATVILALFLIYSFSPHTTAENPEGNATIKETLLSSQELGAAILETYFVGGNYTAAVRTGHSPLDLFTVLPKDRGFEGSSSEPPATPQPITENAFSDAVPANSSFNRSVSLGEGAEPALFLAGEGLDGSNWERVLRKISALNLNASEAIALQEKLNDFLSLVAVFGNYSILEELVDYAKNATDAKIINPDYDAEKAIKEREVPKEIGPEFEVPKEIVLKVSETDPFESESFIVSSALPLGNILIEFSGTAEEDVEFNFLQFNQTSAEFYFEADLTNEKYNEEGLFDFDEKEGEAKLAFSSFPGKVFEISVLLEVEHVKPKKAEETGGFVEDENEIVFEPPAKGPRSAEQCAEDAAKVLAEARKHLGKPYVLACNNYPDSFSCACFVSYAFQKAGFDYWGFSRSASFIYGWASGLGQNDGQGNRNKIHEPYGEEVGMGELVPGDVVFFTHTWDPPGFEKCTPKLVTHVGIYAGDGKLIHAGDPIQEIPFMEYATEISDCGDKIFHSAWRVLDSCKTPEEE
ncbi:hypothetical protein AUJ15_00405 [Candidatus Micrarchaeota archaeon CG1_02_55_41]|nr:MAG: hypothetical protein AUJ15_00405 [Candidatus Micrarchaeota archaeon CG1_02_55_41]